MESFETALKGWLAHWGGEEESDVGLAMSGE